ncbi:DUF1499 domain-containing protein [Accumulibacter sp.]|nr:DUF1499 domain-containing protein [Accumulibacter sp.]HRF03101.1 DUF1499 domain-containing protein [Accumulibacter sp.]
MPKFLQWLGIGVAVLAALLWVAGQIGLLAGTPPSELGVRNGKLVRPLETPNSVSSQAGLWPDHPQREYADIAPLALLRGDGPATIARLKTLLATEPGATLIDSRADYLYVQYTTRVLKFVDDVEFWFDPGNKVIQVRSASRIGRSDLGTNRQRIEALRQRLSAS